MRHALVLAALLVAALAAPIGAGGAPEASVGTPPEGSLYHGVYPRGRSGWEDDIRRSDLAAYEAAAGREAAWVYFSNNWFRSRAFPVHKANGIRDEGAVPFIRLMLRSATGPEGLPDRPYLLQRILDLLSGRWPEVRGFSWWNETWQNDENPAHDTDMRVLTVPGLAEVFQDNLVGAETW